MRTDRRYRNNLEESFYRYFKKNGCTNLYQFPEKHSRIDALMASGNSTVIIEHKSRSESIARYESSKIEYDKFQNMKTAHKLYDNALAAYIMEWQDAVEVFIVGFDREFKWVETLEDFENGSDRKVSKLVGFLPHERADIIISKKDYKRKTTGELMNYIKQMNKKKEDEEN